MTELEISDLEIGDRIRTLEGTATVTEVKDFGMMHNATAEYDDAPGDYDDVGISPTAKSGSAELRTGVVLLEDIEVL